MSTDTERRCEWCDWSAASCHELRLDKRKCCPDCRHPDRAADRIEELEHERDKAVQEGPARSTEVPNEQEPKPGRLVCWECGEPGVPRGPLLQRCVYCDAVYDGEDPTFREGWTEGTP